MQHVQPGIHIFYKGGIGGFHIEERDNAYNICSHESMEQEWSAGAGVCSVANRRNHSDQCGSSVPG